MDRDGTGERGADRQRPQSYGDLTALNTSRLILDSVGAPLLADIASDFLDLLETSAAVYEKNGDYAFGVFTSGWCRFLDHASRRACGDMDNRQALSSGKWLCHESCWHDASRRSIETGEPVDVACRGAIRLYALPVRSGNEIVGSIGFGYGDPPRDPERLRQLAATLGVDVESLSLKAAEYESRPPHIVELAKKRLLAAARLIGEIVERKQAEEALRRLSRNDEEALRVAKMGHWEFDVAAGVFTFNDRYYALHGVTAREAGGYRMTAEAFARNLVHPEDSARVGDAIRQAVEAADPGFQFQTESRILRAGGEVRWVTVWFRIEKDAHGRTIKLHGVNQDVTERKRAEERLRFTQFVMDRSGEPAFWMGPDARIVYVNEAGCRSLGYSREELLSMTIHDFDPDLRREDWAAQWEEIRRRGNFTIESRNRARDGRLFPVEVRVNYVEFEGREYNCAFVRDLSERRKAEEERHNLEARMQDVQKLESLGVLAGGIAHDFNNLLMAILGNADLALHNLSPASPARSSVEDIERASQRAADLCRQMLAYSGKGRFVVGRYDLTEIVREMTRMLEISISKKAALHYRFAGDVPPVQVDVTQMRQVIMNLITNASEALGDDGGVISVSSGAMECDRAYLSESYLDDNLPEGRYVFLEVADTGCGMDAETRRRIFDPFFTTKFAGRGLGLAAVLGIVRGHKGAIKVYSEPGKGTTIKILLPAAEWTPEEREPAAEKSSRPRGSGTILLVDDDPNVRVVGSAMLELLGYKALTASNGREGLEVFRGRGDEITLVILDLTMPEMGGEEAFREIHRLRSDVRVILSSGYNEQDVVQRFAGKGLAGFIQKPYTVAMLRETLDRVFG